MDFEIWNGLSGMKRNTVLRLCHLFWYRIELFGMCKEHYLWINHPYFLKQRPKKIPSFLLQNPKGELIFSRTSEGEQCTFTNTNPRTVFLDKRITDGIFRWTIRVNNNCSSFCIGIASSALLKIFEDVNLGLVNGSCSLVFSTTSPPRLLVAGSINEFPTGEADFFSNNSSIAIEINTTTHTLAFFVGEKKVPLSVTHILRKSISFGMSGNGPEQSFMSLSLCRLLSPTPTPSSFAFKNYPFISERVSSDKAQNRLLNQLCCFDSCPMRMVGDGQGRTWLYCRCGGSFVLDTTIMKFIETDYQNSDFF